MSYTERDTGWAKLCTTFEVNAGEAAAFIGYLRSSGEYRPKAKKGSGKRTKGPKGITMAQLAAVHEYGSRDGHIPERSFMRSTIAANKDVIDKLIKALVKQIVLGRKTKTQALAIVGQAISDMMRATIQAGVAPVNAPSTIARKGSSHTLIDTGQLLGAIDWDVRAGKVA